MRIKCHAQGKFYLIECPEGTRIVRGADRPNGDVPFHDHLIVPLNGNEIHIPTDPPELLPLLAESGNFGVSLVGEPQADKRLAGASCPDCGQDDVKWLQLGDGSEMVHCDYCGTDIPLPQVAPVSDSGLTVDRLPFDSP